MILNFNERLEQERWSGSTQKYW